MCRILIMKVDQTNANPEKDRKQCYKIGDCVGTYPDGATIPSHLLEDCWIINCPGMDPRQALDLLTQTQINPDYPDIIWRRRREFFDRMKLPANIRNRLERDGEITVDNWAKYLEYITAKGL